MAMLRLHVLVTAYALLHAASARPERRALFASLPSPTPRADPSWLLAATGTCMHQQYLELKGEAGSPYIARVEFTFMPSTTLQFTDAPYRQAFEIVSPDDQINELADVDWSYKNVALLEPDADWSYKNVALLEPDADGTDWAISTFEIEEHGISEGSDAVLYSGRVTARSSNFPGVRIDTFPCQLFVDAATKLDGAHNTQCVSVRRALDDEGYSWDELCPEGDPNCWNVACAEGDPDCICGKDDGPLTCRSYGTGKGWLSKCCKCNEQIIGGNCVDCISDYQGPGCESTCR